MPQPGLPSLSTAAKAVAGYPATYDAEKATQAYAGDLCSVITHSLLPPNVPLPGSEDKSVPLG